MTRLVVYVRRAFCPDVKRTREYLARNSIPHVEVDADADPAARERVRAWTGFLSFPTLVIAEGDSLEPVVPPAPLRKGQSPRDVDRGSMLTEPSSTALEAFLKRHGLLNAHSS